MLRGTCQWPNLLAFCAFFLLRYYIPKPQKQGLVFYRNIEQKSFESTGVGVESSGKYCTAWFNHGMKPLKKKARYEYAVQVDAEPIGKPGKKAIDPSKFYEVEKKNRNAHVVKFPSKNGRGTVHGYVVFPVAPAQPITFSSGPLSNVYHQSIIMVEEKSNKLYISLTSPKLNMKTKSNSPSWCNSGNTNPRTMDKLDETLLYCSKSTDQSVHVHLNANAPTTLTSLYVGGSEKTSDKDHFVKQETPKTSLAFMNLRNGADTEIVFEKKSQGF